MRTFFNDKWFIVAVAFTVLCQPLAFAEDSIVAINHGELKFQGLYRTEPTRVPNGSHTKFDNVYLYQDTLRAVKGRDRLTTSANADATNNGMTYYDNAAGSVKKLIIKEASSMVSYTVAGATRTAVVANGLTNEKVDFAQIGDTLYFTSATDGLYKWTGSSTASAVGAVTAPAAVDFTAGAIAGGLTPGNNIGLTPNLASDGDCNNLCNGSSSDNATCFFLDSHDMGGSGVTSDAGTLEQAATTTTYSYKITKYSSLWGIESEPSTADTVSMTGDTTFTWSATNCKPCDTTYNDYSCDETCCTGVSAVTTGRATSTTGTLIAAPASPFDSYRIYRTVASGSDYFLLGMQTTGAYIDGRPDTSLGQPLDTTVDTITAPSYQYIAEYKGHIFLGEGTTVAFSRLAVATATDADTYWLNTDNINLGTKKPMTGMHATSDSLLLFTENTVKELTGFGATSFKVKNSLQDVGTVSDATIETDLNGDIIFFGGTSGVYKLRTFDQPQVDVTGESVENNRRVSIQRISSPALDVVFQGNDSQIDLDPTTYSSSHAYYDTDNDLYFLYVNEHCFIYDNKHASWSHMPATNMTGSVWRKTVDSTGVGVIYDNAGFFYNNWTGYENGIHSGTVTGNPTASGNTTLTDAGATFNTTGDGLKGLWVFLDNEAGEWRQITTNTGTQITVSSAWTVNPGTSDVYYIGYIIPNITTARYSFGAVPERTNANYIYVIHGKSDTTQTLYMDIFSYVDMDLTATNAKSFDLTTNYVDKIGTKGLGFWHDWEMKTYIYNTSNTIDPPLNILEYGLVGNVIKEK